MTYCYLRFGSPIIVVCTYLKRALVGEVSGALFGGSLATDARSVSDVSDMCMENYIVVGARCCN